MSEDIKLKMSLSEELFSTFALRGKRVKTNNMESGPSTSYEVFRNNTTAVEVIVKEVPRDKKKEATPEYHDAALQRRLQEDIERLRKELNRANNSLDRTRKCYRSCLREMQKQVETANQREIDTKAKNMALLLENEKLKTFLISKTNLVNKLKKELASLRRIIKFVVKSILASPQADTGNVTGDSDPEYDDFENDLKKDFKKKFAGIDETTFDSTMSNVKNKFDKRLYE